MTIPPWQLAIRFGLEVASLIAVGRYAGSQLRGPWSLVVAWAVPGAVALLWVTFAVKGDPSRSGNAPVPVPGPLRLALELAVFGGERRRSPPGGIGRRLPSSRSRSSCTTP